MKEVNQLYEELLNRGLFTEAELQLVTDINGYSKETLNSCIYARYAYHNLEQLIESEGK